MDVEQTIYRKVVTFLGKELLCDPNRLGPHTRLRQDLGVGIDNAETFFEAFAVEFDVDIESFRINDYFGDVPTMNGVLMYLLSVFGNAKILKTLRVCDLVWAAEQGRLPPFRKAV